MLLRRKKKASSEPAVYNQMVVPSEPPDSKKSSIFAESVIQNQMQPPFNLPTRIVYLEPTSVPVMTSFPSQSARPRRRHSAFGCLLYAMVCALLCMMCFVWGASSKSILPLKIHVAGTSIEIGAKYIKLDENKIEIAYKITHPYTVVPTKKTGMQTGAIVTRNLASAPTITSEFIDKVLDYYNSPATGKGQALYDFGVKYQIDPSYALAFFMHESSFGTRGVARVTHSLGNIRATEGYTSYQGYRSYDTWEAGFEDWYRLIRNQYMDQWQLATVSQIIPRYAPSADNNNEDEYINSVERAVQLWRDGIVAIS